MKKRRLNQAGVLAFAVCAVVGAAWAQSAVTRLGVAENNAHQLVLSAMRGGYGFYGNASKSFLALGPSARAMAVNDVVAWAKAYVKSDAFKQAWAKEREDAKPKAPVVSGTTDDAVKSYDAQVQKQIDDLKKAAASMQPDQRKVMEETIKQITAQMEASAKDPSQQALKKQAIEGERTGDQTRYQSDLKKWQEDFPVDPSPVIAQRLRDFLTMSADVNFDAKVINRDGRKYFADEQYEHKPEEWKICFRAGREATSAARSAATAWLAQLGK